VLFSFVLFCFVFFFLFFFVLSRLVGKKDNMEVLYVNPANEPLVEDLSTCFRSDFCILTGSSDVGVLQRLLDRLRDKLETKPSQKHKTPTKKIPPQRQTVVLSLCRVFFVFLFFFFVLFSAQPKSS